MIPALARFLDLASVQRALQSAIPQAESLALHQAAAQFPMLAQRLQKAPPKGHLHADTEAALVQLAAAATLLELEHSSPIAAAVQRARLAWSEAGASPEQSLERLGFALFEDWDSEGEDPIDSVSWNELGESFTSLSVLAGITETSVAHFLARGPLDRQPARRRLLEVIFSDGPQLIHAQPLQDWAQQFPADVPLLPDLLAELAAVGWLGPLRLERLLAIDQNRSI